MLNTAVVFAAPVELTLEDSIATALKNNPAIKMSDEDRQAAEWAITQAKGGKMPSLTITNSDGRESTSSSGSFSVATGFTNTATLTLPIYTGGKVEASVEAAELGYKVADLGVEQSKQQVQLSATTGYFNILQAINVVKVSQEAVDQMQAHLDNVQAQYKVGVVAKTDVLSSEVAVANDQQQLIVAQNGYDLAISTLNNVMGLPLDTEIKVKDDLKHEKYDLSLEDCIKTAMVQRPEAIQADYGIAVAKANVKKAQGGNLPTLSAQASKGWAGTSFPGLDNNNGWSVGLVASWDAFDSGVTNSEIKQAEAAERKSVQAAQQTKDGIRLAVQQAYLNMNAADKSIASTQVTVEQGEENFKISEVRYSAGVGTNVDVIDAEVALTQAKNNYIQALYNYNTARANLDQAIGKTVVSNQ